MKKKKVIKTDNIATKPPLFTTAAWMTILHYWGAPQWLMGIFGFLLFVAWIVYFRSFAAEEAIDIFEDKA